MHVLFQLLVVNKGCLLSATSAKGALYQLTVLNKGCPLSVANVKQCCPLSVASACPVPVPKAK